MLTWIKGVLNSQSYAIDFVRRLAGCYAGMGIVGLAIRLVTDDTAVRNELWGFIGLLASGVAGILVVDNVWKRIFTSKPIEHKYHLNGREHVTGFDELTYEQLVAMFMKQTDAYELFTVVCEYPNHPGVVVPPTGSVKMEDGLKVTVVACKPIEGEPVS